MDQPMHPQQDSKTKLLDATLKVVRTKGYAATRIDDVCAEAGLTKGNFFHHFSTGDALPAGRSSNWPDHLWSIRSRSVIDRGFWRVSGND